MTHDMGTEADAIEPMAWMEARGVLSDVHPDMTSEDLVWCARSGVPFEHFQAVRERLAAMPMSPVAVSEAMIDAGAEATWAELDSMDLTWERYRETYERGAQVIRNAANACLTAALSVQEASLEDVLGNTYYVTFADKRVSGECCANVTHWHTGQTWAGIGPTIDAAIRDAVRRAEGGEGVTA